MPLESAEKEQLSNFEQLWNDIYDQFEKKFSPEVIEVGEGSGKKVVFRDQNNLLMGLILYYVKDETLYVEYVGSIDEEDCRDMNQPEINYRRQGLSTAFIAYALKDNPNVRYITGSLVGVNEKEFKANFAGCRFKAFMQTPGYKALHRLGFSTIKLDQIAIMDSYGMRFTCRLPYLDHEEVEVIDFVRAHIMALLFSEEGFKPFDLEIPSVGSAHISRSEEDPELYDIQLDID